MTATAPTEPASPRPTARPALLAAGGYLLLGLLLMAPVLPIFAEAIPGGEIAAIDGWQNVWNLWWVGQAAARGADLFRTELLFFPFGTTLHLQTLGSTNGLLALPITLLWGPVAGYNAALLLALSLSGLAGYALARQVGAGPWAAFLAGLLFTLAPSHLTRVADGQLELSSMQWPALYALFLLRTVEGGRWRDALAAGVLLALTGLSSLYYLLYMGVYSAAFALLWVRRGALLGRLALAGATAALLLAPVLVPAVTLALGRSGAVYLPEGDEVVRRSANLLDLLVPSTLHPLWGPWAFRTFIAAWHDYGGSNVPLGYSVIGLAALGAATAWARAWRWLALAGAMLLLALGPQLQVGAWTDGPPMPYALLAQLPGLENARRPALFVAIATIALVGPTALGLQAIGAALGRGAASAAHPAWSRGLAWAAVVALIGLELLPQPMGALPATVHPAYAGLLQSGDGVVLEVPPAAYKYVEAQRGQLAHGRPIIGGYLARPPRYDWPNDIPGVRPLWKMRPDRFPSLIEGSGGPLDAFAALGVSDVVVRWDEVEPERRATVREALAQALPGVEPIFSDEMLTVYRLPAVEPEPVAALVPDSWGWPEGDGGASWRWMGAAGEILLINPGDQVRRLTLTLVAKGHQGPRDVGLTLDGARAGTWRVGQGPTRTRMTLWLPPGEHRLRLSAPTLPETPGSDRGLSIALLDARLDPGPEPSR